MITIYGHQRCVWCKKAKDLAEMYSLPYQWLDTDNFENLNNLKQKLPEVRTVPQIWWHEKHIGGYEDLLTEIQNTISNHGDGII